MAQLVEQTIRNRQVMGSNPIGGSHKTSGFSPVNSSEGKTIMFYSRIHEQTILEISPGDTIRATADSSLNDRQAGELPRHTLKFYREFLRIYASAGNTDSISIRRFLSKTGK